MKLLWLFFVLPAISVQAACGYSYLINSRLCREWNCINTKLGLPNALPPKDTTKAILTQLLPPGAWQSVVDTVLDNCYENRTKRYTNTCPGQALLHCVVDQLIRNCPEESLSKDDSCSMVTSLAGLNTMFSQSKYIGLEKNLPSERRPAWFLTHYFEQKCCNVPELFNATLLQECGFNSFIAQHTHEPKYQETHTPNLQIQPRLRLPPVNNDDDIIKAVDLNLMTTPMPSVVDSSTTDPLDCCDMSEFIQPSWRSQCGFQLTWRGHDRLVITNTSSPMSTETPTTSTVGPEPPKDLMLLPQPCLQETCVFRKLGIIGDTGNVDTMAYMKLLDNFTDAHQTWKKAKARVVTKCLSKKVKDYEGECEINKILACTLDVLTENCPYKRKSEDTCKHNKHKTGCQISSSKFRPKHRREICLLPPLVSFDLLSECGLDYLYRTEHVVVQEPKPKYAWQASQYLCQDQFPSTTCLLQNMGLLNKYKFMDYFRMKDKIRQFTKQGEWAALQKAYISAFINIPMYGDHCSSQKKLLNVIDAMIMTCPISKRVNTPQCTKIFKDMIDTTPIDNQNATKQRLHEIMKHYHSIFLADQPTTPKITRVTQKKHTKTHKKPIYNYGLLDSEASPKVKVIDVKPMFPFDPTKPIPIILPVYLREKPSLEIATPFYNDGVMRSNPFALHEKIAAASVTTPRIPSTASFTTPRIPSTASFTTPASTSPLVPFLYNTRSFPSVTPAIPSDPFSELFTPV
ncbi:uncharacterized protein LOC142976113 [Anticarsia gemmatalis]|uniref:uncharacterized protein LOC142976113 n=1 Tax=Anticarsia gemmatalis TaxID=129554 RepID=UPI003F757C51